MIFRNLMEKYQTFSKMPSILDYFRSHSKTIDKRNSQLLIAKPWKMNMMLKKSMGNSKFAPLDSPQIFQTPIDFSSEVQVMPQREQLLSVNSSTICLMLKLNSMQLFQKKSKQHYSSWMKESKQNFHPNEPKFKIFSIISENIPNFLYSASITVSI